ncbi:hypothetical protein BZA77DRAFT_304638 [Pyronema omphalodes]|nr:hypothetical protein BZA77DRAFT_304638 [Pyronema omphalodes]
MTSGFPHFQMDPSYLQHHMNDRRSFFDDDEASSILDDNILNNELLDAPLDMMSRRREDIFSPTAEWDFDHDMMSGAGPADDSTPVPAATFEHSNGTNNPFIKLEQAQPAYAQQHNWSGASGSCTPTVNDYDGAYGYDASGAYLAPSMGAQGAYDNNVHIPPHAVFPAGVSTPTTPTDKHWTNGAGPADHDGQSIKRMRPSSPGPRAHSPLHVVRRDGIRKKNARFDIPAERTLMNIDQLIARSQDENEIKELKQQKRLLRNRQAALDSRQRKKQHTERLEEEKKLHSNIIQELEDKMAQLTHDTERMRQEYQAMVEEREFMNRKVQALLLEKEEMVRSHTLETGELRKKNAFLENQLVKMQENMDRAPMSHQSSSSGFSDDFDFDNELNFDTWTNEPIEPVSKPVESEKPAAPGLLLILLLCGAFVASSKTATPALPPLPKQLQTASASVLQNIFQDAGVSEVGRVEPIDPLAGTEAWTVARSAGAPTVGLENTMNIINSFDRATGEQQREQLSQLTPAEYNEVTSNNYLRDAEPVNARNRRRIQENLANMRNSKPSAAEVYTRSLLWDRVDADVVRRFASFVRQAQSSGASGNDESGAAAAHS